MKEIWNTRYAKREYIYGKDPNIFFKEELKKLNPGNILLPSEGEGRNAVHASLEGWSVAAFDFSEAAQQKAFLLAEEKNARINYAVLSIENFGCASSNYNVIALIYAHYPPALRKSFHSKLINCLLPGGFVILEAFGKDQINNDTGGPKDIKMLYSEKELREDFKELEIKTLYSKEIQLKEGELHNGKSSVIRMIAQKKLI